MPGIEIMRGSSGPESAQMKFALPCLARKGQCPTALLLTLLFVSLGQVEPGIAASPGSGSGSADFPKPLAEYHDKQITNIPEKLVHRVLAEPFNLVGTLIFLAAVMHTFLASRFMQVSHHLQDKFQALEEQEKNATADKQV